MGILSRDQNLVPEHRERRRPPEETWSRRFARHAVSGAPGPGLVPASLPTEPVAAKQLVYILFT